MRLRLSNGMLYALALAGALWTSPLALSADTKAAPPRTPQTGIDPGIRVDPGPSPDPHTAVAPKSNPDPGMVINPDVVRPKFSLPPEAKPPPNVTPPDRTPETRPDTEKQQ